MVVAATTTERVNLPSYSSFGIYSPEIAFGELAIEDIYSAQILQSSGVPQTPQEAIRHSFLVGPVSWQVTQYTEKTSFARLMLGQPNLASGHGTIILTEPKEGRFVGATGEIISSHRSSMERQQGMWSQGISTSIPFNQMLIYIQKVANAIAIAKAAPAADPLDIARQLDGMRNMEDGWAEGMQHASRWGEGYGRAPSAKGLDWLAAQFRAHYPADLPRPYLYPTPEGGVQAEWTLAAYEVSLEIDIGAHSAEWYSLNHHIGQSDERRLDLNKRAAWKWLDAEVRQLGSDNESLKGLNEAVTRGERPARRFTSQADLRKFFEYTSWAAGPEPEPDWSEHLRILQESQLKGIANS